MKGEKIVSVLCKSAVNPARPSVWPNDWKKPDPILERKEFGFVEAVYLKDNQVWLLISNAYDGKMGEFPAIDWVIETRGWDR